MDTSTPWTAEEDKILVQMLVQRSGGKKEVFEAFSKVRSLVPLSL